MIQIKTTENQTIFDIAKQYYGNIEAVAEILENNTKVFNDGLNEYTIDRPFKPGTRLQIDDQSKLRNINVIRKIHKDILLWQEHSKR